MRQIRLNTFETNSSSTHSMVIGTEEQIEKWYNGELFVDFLDSCAIVFKTKEQLGEMEQTEEFFYPDDWVDGNDWEDRNDNLEFDRCSFTTPHGDKMKAIVAYGFDG